MIDGVQATTDNSSASPVASYSPAPGSPPHRSSTHGNDSDDHQLDHFDSALESATPVEKRCTYGAWLFLCQIYALCWKQYLVKKRRPLSTIFEILAPGLMLLILSYGIGLSPVVPIPAFQHDTVPTVYSNYTTSTDINPTAAFLVQLFESAGLYSPSNPASYFQTVLLPLLTSQSGNASIATQLSSIVFSNTDAARPFVIPGFDTYVGGITQLKAATGRLGGKSLENLDPRIWHIMNLGKIAFGNPSDDVRDMIAYFNATTNLFGSIVLCPLPTSAACNGHISSNSAESLAVALGTSVWAYIDIDVFDVPTQTFHYTIRMNESLVPPTDTIIDQFPQGIGTAYAKYIYAGFATIQYELNEYFRRRVLSYQVNAGTLVAPPIEFGPIPLFESCCNDIVNHTNMFAPANNSDQYNLLQTLLAITPPTKTIVRYPAPLLSTQYPCNFDLMTNCSGLNGSATLDVISCLNQQHETAGSCGIAISYVQQCSATIKTLCNVEAVDFFNIQPNPVSADDCWSKVSGDATCGASSLFGQLINTTGLVTTSLPCGHESMSYCGTPQCSPEDAALGKQCRPDFGCLRQAFDEGRPMSSVCQAALMAVPLCVDDFATICPFDTNSMSVAQIPAVCLHLQRDYISLTCLTSDFFAFVEAVYTDAALIQTVPTDVNFCRTAHQVSLAFYDGVTAGAFPARAYGQNQFYANSGALIGLVVALSFLYPFTAHIRLIVQERTKKQRLYMMLIGVHHSAILVTYTLIGFVLSFLSAIFATVVLSEIFPQVGTDAIFSLFFTYGFSLVGLASFVASFFSSTRLSGAIAPFILFLLAIPAFVVVGSIDFITYLLPPSVAILAADLFVGYSQSSATSAVFSDDLTTATQALFGLGILYIILALLVEQFRVMSTSIGMVGRFSRTVNDRLFGAYRFVMHPFRKTRVYSRLNQQQQVDDEAGNIELAEGGGVHSLNDDGSQEERLTSGGGYGYENFEESMAAAPSTNPNDLRYSIGGVDQDGQAAGGGSSPSSRRSSVGSHQGRQQVWHAAIQLFNVTTSFLTTTSDSASVVLKNVSGLFYKNRLNCVIGGTGSGKSTLIRILMGEWSPDSGKFTIDDEEPTRFNRQDLGVCLQQDVSWDQLTVAEHIELVQLVKGCINLEFMKEEVKTLLSVLNLEDKRDAHADTLSYGMLRKLNVAMSFAGGSRIVLLDEPTASIDPLSRKAVWHLLSANVTNRCIVVSTSYVEELDDAHHIMLLRDGAVKCAGTPQHLKRVTGSVGSFILSVSRGQSLRSDQAMQVVAQLCPKAQLANNVGQELCFRIPRDHAGTLPILLKALRSLRGVSSVAVSDHRLDELFMRVTREQGVREDLFNALTRRVEENFDATTRSMAPMSGDSMAGPSSGYVRDTSASSSANLASPTSASQPSHAATAGGNSIGSDRERDMRLQPGSFALFRQSFSVIFGKRFAVGLSSLLPSTIQFLLPLICISVAMSLLDATSPTYPPLVLDTSAMYGTNDVYMSLENAAPSSSKVKWQTAADVFYNRGTRYIVPSTVGVPWNSSVAVSALLAEEMDNHATPRYGALIVNDTFVNFNIENFLFNATSGLTFSLGNTTLAWKTDSILHNTSSPHALPAFLNNLASMRIWKMTGDTSGGIQVTNFPLPYVTGLVSTSTLIVSIISSILLLVPFTFFPAMFVSSVVKERSSGMLDLQYSSRLSPVAYWLATFAWHMLVFSLFSFFAIIMYMSSEKAVLEGFGQAFFAWFVMVLYGACVISISYIMSKMFKKHSTAQNSVTMFHFSCGFVLVAAANAVNLLPDNAETVDAKNTNDSLMVLFRFLPTYALGESFIKLSMIPLQNILHTNIDLVNTLSDSIRLMFLFPLYLGALIMYEQRSRIEFPLLWRHHIAMPFRKFLRGQGFSLELAPWEDDRLLMVDDDPSVTTERSRASGSTGLNAVDLWRRYESSSGSLNAVQNVPMHVGMERLIVMGPSGAGKSTLLRCMSGVEKVSCGNVIHRGHDMTTTSDGYWTGRSMMGYAGDLQGVNEELTPYYMMHTMAALRGIRATRQRDQHIQFLLTTMGLWKHRDVSCKHLSLVLQRRIAVALSLVGFPETVILDEPTTGLDPVGRRQFWATLQAVPSTTSLLMSSQWSEDVDMIASRVMLLDGGKVRQIGPADELRERSRHGGVSVTFYWRQEYQLSQDVLERRAAQKERVLEFMGNTWPLCTPSEESINMLRFRIPDRTMATLDSVMIHRPSGDDAPALPQQEEVRSAVRDAFLALDDISISAPSSAANNNSTTPPNTSPTTQSSPSSGQQHPIAIPPPAAAPASPASGSVGTRLEDIFSTILAQRAAWTHNSLWASTSPHASPLTRSPESDQGLPAPAPQVPAPFEFEVSESTFSSMLDVTVGSHSSTVQHIRNVLNMPSVLKVRADGGTA